MLYLLEYGIVKIIPSSLRKTRGILLVYNEIGGGEYVQVVGNGVKNYKVLLNELYPLIDRTKFTKNTYLTLIDLADNEQRFNLAILQSARMDFTISAISASGAEANILSMRMMPGASSYTAYDYFAIKSSGNTYNNLSNTVPISGVIIRVYY